MPTTARVDLLEAALACFAAEGFEPTTMARIAERAGVPGSGPAPWLRLFWVRVGPVSVPVPHPGQLQWHDLHHLVLGYRTDLVGEMEISAFELRTTPRTAIVFLLCVAGVATGLLWAPRRTMAAWRRARGWRNLYGSGLAHDEVVGWTMEALRAWMEPALRARTRSSPPR